MATHHFTFKFPDDLKALPRSCRYEVLPGNVGLFSIDGEVAMEHFIATGAWPGGSIRAIDHHDMLQLIENTKTFDQIERVPSFTKQTKWPSGFFDLPETPGTCFFNPGLEWWNGSLHLFARRSVRTRKGFATLEDNDLVIFRLNPDFSPASFIIPTPPNRYPREQWEDPRAFVADGKCYVSMATLIRGIAWKIRQSLCVMSEDLSRFSVVCESEFGGNHSEPMKATGHEKNWTWFNSQDDLHCVYSLHPLTIFVPNYYDGTLARRVDSKPPESIPWQHGTLRGGTNPELSDGEYLTFFHSSMLWKDAFGSCVMGTRRRYYMGALTFTSEPPFHITSITPKPLLVGSEDDPRTLEGPPVVFPCGAKLINGSWLVTMGINDERCGWISIPHEELKGLIVKI